MDEFLLNWSPEKIAAHFDDDALLVRMCNAQRLKLPSSPEQSEFRVYAFLIVLEDNTKLVIVEGSNAEQGYIGGAICAERAALCAMRRVKNPKIVKVVVVTVSPAKLTNHPPLPLLNHPPYPRRPPTLPHMQDSATPIAPGLLCREFLLSHCAPDTPIVIGSSSDELVCKPLGALYPHPFAYRYKRRGDQVAFAQQRSELCQEVRRSRRSDQKRVEGTESNVSFSDSGAGASTSAVQQQGSTACTNIDAASLTAESPLLLDLLQCAVTAAGTDSMVALHPLQFGAAVLFSDGSVEVASILKALEYGCSVDPVAQLVREMVLRRGPTEAAHSSSSTSSGLQHPRAPPPSTPVCVVMTDQFGVAHAPFAPARSALVEHGFGDVQVLVHGDMYEYRAGAGVGASGEGVELGGRVISARISDAASPSPGLLTLRTAAALVPGAGCGHSTADFGLDCASAAAATAASDGDVRSLTAEDFFKS